MIKRIRVKYFMKMLLQAKSLVSKPIGRLFWKIEKHTYENGDVYKGQWEYGKEYGYGTYTAGDSV